MGFNAFEILPEGLRGITTLQVRTTLAAALCARARLGARVCARVRVFVRACVRVCAASPRLHTHGLAAAVPGANAGN